MQNRIYAIDKLRAVMMLLGVVLHSALAYAVKGIPGALPLTDAHSSNILFNAVIIIVHIFRMPVFFVISGFLTAMLYVERGAVNMLRNRLYRLLYPFIAGLVILYPATVISVNYFIQTRAGAARPFAAALQVSYTGFAWRGIQPGHLWFLYYLILYCVLGCTVSLAAAKILFKTGQKANSYFKAAFLSAYAPLIFATATYICLFKIKLMVILTPQNFMINTVFLAYGCFFAFGWMLYHCRGQLNRFMQQDKLFTCAGMLLLIMACLVLMARPGMLNTPMVYLLMAFTAAATWLLIFGLTGLFFRYFNNYSVTARYIADASYWIYLVHLPIVIILQGWLLHVNVNTFIKFTVVLGVTTLICLVTYQYLVRDTMIGQFLNGQRYKKGILTRETVQKNNISL